jgi:hypothetical protein
MTMLAHIQRRYFVLPVALLIPLAASSHNAQARAFPADSLQLRRQRRHSTLAFSAQPCMSTCG